MPYGTPAEMSPYQNQNKGYAKQEKKDLLQDNPVARDASGGRPWIAKHFKSSMSPLKEGHEGGSPMSDKGHGEKFTDEHFPSGKHRSDLNMNHNDSPASQYGSPAEKHCMGPRMDAEEAEQVKRPMLVKKMGKKKEKK